MLKGLALLALLGGLASAPYERHGQESVFISVIERTLGELAAEGVPPRSAKDIDVGRVASDEDVYAPVLHTLKVFAGNGFIRQDRRIGVGLSRPQIMASPSWAELGVGFFGITIEAPCGRVADHYATGRGLAPVVEGNPCNRSFARRKIANLDGVHGQIGSELTFGGQPCDRDGLPCGVRRVGGFIHRGLSSGERFSDIPDADAGEPQLAQGEERHEALSYQVTYRQPLALLVGLTLILIALPLAFRAGGRDRGAWIAGGLPLFGGLIWALGVWDWLSP